MAGEVDASRPQDSTKTKADMMVIINYVFETPESLAQLRRALNEIDEVT